MSSSSHPHHHTQKSNRPVGKNGVEKFAGIPDFFYDLKAAEPEGHATIHAERSRATFPVPEMTRFLFGKHLMEVFEEVGAVLESDETFSKEHRYYLGRTERFAERLKQDGKFAKIARELHWDDERRTVAALLIDEPGSFTLHTGMFMPCIMSQGNEEQKKHWLGLAHNYRIIGCYAQTELGHGSNVQGLETTATYIPETQEFEIHSPTLTSSKWWVGGLGKVATHAVVMARLMTLGKDYGPHPFIVPIRSLKDHKALPGIMVGDIGPKMGFNCVDNGFVLFHHYRIPRMNMLMKYSQVQPDGKYVAPPVQKISYGTMIFVRAYLVASSALALSRGATVATRYSAIRRQFTDPQASKNDPIAQASLQKKGSKIQQKVETAVIDYSLQQYRLFPIIAKSYALHFTGFWMMGTYFKMMKEFEGGNMDLLPEVHAASSGLKSLTTTIAAAGIEESRRACGGHGYSLFSGLPDFLNTFLPLVTLEGDNHLLTQQTARYLLKQHRLYKSDPTKIPTAAASTTAYLGERLKTHWAPTTDSETCQPQLLLDALAHRSTRLVASLAADIAGGQTWNDSLIDAQKVSRAHCQFILLRNFVSALHRANHVASSPSGKGAAKLVPVLTTLCSLFGLITVEEELSEVMEDGYVTPIQARWIRTQIKSHLAAIRPNAVALVDAWGIPDYVLHSALGRHDGRVYETLFEMALKEPLNVTSREHGDVVPGYEEYIRPLIQRGITPKSKM